MYLGKKIIAIIPARGGSKGIPGKNIRLLDNKPLIYYAIENALSSNYIDKVIVTSEDERVLELVRLKGIQAVKRPYNLSLDNVTLDPVIFHAVRQIEERENENYDIVITLQPTCPLLKTKTIDDAIRVLINQQLENVIAVIESPHLYWKKEKRNKIVPLFKSRKNRQYLKGYYRETGAFLIAERKIVTQTSRIGRKIELFPINEEEGLDIDHFSDWWVAENVLEMPKIGFIVDGDHNIGLGHVYRALTLAHRISSPRVVFLIKKGKALAIQKVIEHNYPIYEYSEMGELLENIDKLDINLIINDILDTSIEFMQALRKKNKFIVNFEDLGDGGELANLVINALYEHSHSSKKYYYGYKYLCLRDEFYRYPIKDVQQVVNNVVIMFGGVDPNNLTMKTLSAFGQIGNKKLNIIVILGLGYKYKKQLYSLVNKLSNKGFNIQIEENTSSVAKLLSSADMAVTSNGRTVYEVASLGIPCISISQNERETRHLFSYFSKGIRNLGLFSSVSNEILTQTIKELLDSYEIRNKMNSSIKHVNLRSGMERTLQLIFESYNKWRNNRTGGKDNGKRNSNWQ